MSAFPLYCAALGAASAVGLDYAFITHANKVEMEKHQAFLQAHPAVMMKPGDVVPTFPQDPTDTPTTRAARDRRLKAVLVGAPALTALVGALLFKSAPSGNGWTASNGQVVGYGLAAAGLGALAVNLYFVLGGPIPIPYSK